MEVFIMSHVGVRVPLQPNPYLDMYVQMAYLAIQSQIIRYEYIDLLLNMQISSLFTAVACPHPFLYTWTKLCRSVVGRSIQSSVPEELASQYLPILIHGTAYLVGTGRSPILNNQSPVYRALSLSSAMIDCLDVLRLSTGSSG